MKRPRARAQTRALTNTRALAQTHTQVVSNVVALLTVLFSQSDATRPIDRGIAGAHLRAGMRERAQERRRKRRRRRRRSCERVRTRE